VVRPIRPALAALVVVATTVVVALAGRDDDPAPREGSPAVEPTASTTVPTVPTVPTIGTPGAAGVGDPYFPNLGNGGYDVAHYDLELAWSGDGQLDGVARIDASATQALSAFNLDLAGMAVASVTVDGVPARTEQVDRELVVTPASTIPDDAAFTTVVTYGGRPQPVSDGTDLFEVGWQTDGREAFVASEPGGASTFFPVNDHPTDKATYTLTVTAPEDQVVAANGVLVDEADADDGRRSWTYEADDPMASYLVQIVIGDYLLEDAGSVDGVVLRHAFHRSLADAARVATSRTGEMLEMLTEVYGPYPFDAYGVVAVDEPLGFALETQTLTIIGSDIAVQGRGADSILLHELAHQWVGNAVSPATWRDVWLNEGFATYSEWLWTERTGGQPASVTARNLASSPGAGLDRPPGDPGFDELFGTHVYWRGGMALQALREAIGDPAFFEVLRAWVDEHSGSTASTADLVALAERISGQPLNDLFYDWLYADGLPGFGLEAELLGRATR
jgi:aminopeptidase N